MLNDIALIEPSEKIINKKPKIKITLLYFRKLNSVFDFIIKQLAINAETIMYSGNIDLLYISWKTGFIDSLSQTNNLSKKPLLLLINEFIHSNNLPDPVSWIFGKIVDLVSYLDKLNSDFLNLIILVLSLSMLIIFPKYKIKK